MSFNSRHIIKFIVFAIIATAVFCFIPDEALARAGGGGGGKGGGILTIIMLPFILIYSFILSRYIARKHRQSKKILEKLSVQDDRWNIEKLNDRIEMIYFKVQEAWRERDQAIARDFMSNRLFEKHKLQTDQMIQQRRRNMLERVSLKKVTIVEAADYLDDSRDRIWAVLKGSMVDYIIDDKSNQIISGDSDKVEDFKELWKFVYDDKCGWVLDEIDSEVEISDLRNFKSFSENLGMSGKKETSKGNMIVPGSYSYLILMIVIGLLLPWVIVVGVAIEAGGFEFIRALLR